MHTLARHAALAPGEGLGPQVADLDVIVEALKCLCNVILNSVEAQEAAAHLGLMVGVVERLKQCRESQWSSDVRFFDLRLAFLLTALRVDVRAQLARELRGARILADALDATLGLQWTDAYEVSRSEAEGPSDLPPLGRSETERAMEILKILFNITYDTGRRKVDEVRDSHMTRNVYTVISFTVSSHATLSLCVVGYRRRQRRTDTWEPS